MILRRCAWLLSGAMICAIVVFGAQSNPAHADETVVVPPTVAADAPSEPSTGEPPSPSQPEPVYPEGGPGSAAGSEDAIETEEPAGAAATHEQAGEAAKQDEAQQTDESDEKEAYEGAKELGTLEAWEAFLNNSPPASGPTWPAPM